MRTDEKTSGKKRGSLTGWNTDGSHRGSFMTVTQMGELLGLKRTERYWLLNKKVFETRSIQGKTMVDVASFEKWYAGQIHYRKVTGEEPSLLINAATYSIHNISEMLGISESRVYALIKREHLETVTVDFRMRVPRKAFNQWYSTQSRYRTAKDRLKENGRFASTITVPQMATLLGISTEQGYSILEDNNYECFFKCVFLNGQQRITREDFEAFLSGQDRFHLVDTVKMADYSNNPDTNDIELPETANQEPKDADKNKTLIPRSKHAPDFITIAEAAEMANVTRQMISKLADRGKINCTKVGSRIRIHRRDFEKWLQDRETGR